MFNLVPRVSPLPAPWSERRETLVWSGHVSPRIWEITKDNIEGGAAKSGVWLYLGYHGTESICIKNNTSGLCHSKRKLREVNFHREI